MRLSQAFFLFIMCASLSSGCLARQVAEDGKGIRQALVDMYTDQALDNLVRASENKPFVQLKYSMLSVMDTDDVMATVANSEADFSSNKAKDLSKTAPNRLTRGTGFIGKFPLIGSGERDRLMTFHADPVTDQNYIYESYLAFARNPGLFVVSDSKPCGPVHAFRRCGDKWYWVPKEAGADFLQLVIQTSFAPPPAAPAEVYYDSAIAAVTWRFDKQGKRAPNGYVLTLTKEVPNDDGWIRVLLNDGRKLTLPVLRLDTMPFEPGKADQKEVPGLPLGAPTTKLYTQFDASVLPVDAITQLPGTPVQFFSRSFPNPNPKPTADTQKVLDALETIRLQLLKSNPNVP